MNRLMTGRRTALLASFATLLLFFAVVPVSAQEIREVSFNEAVQIALDGNVTIKRAQNSLALQAITVRSERADFYPNLNFNTSASRNFGLQFDQTTGTLETTSTDGFNYSASTGINLFSGFVNVATLASARALLDAQEFTLERTKQNIVFSVISNYLNVILSEETIRIQQENVQSQRGLLEQIEEFVRVGSRAISDQYQQQATLANSELVLLNAENSYQTNMTRLIQVLQLDPLGEYRFLAPNADELPLIINTFDPEAMLLGAFENRVDLRAQQFVIDAAQQGIRVAKAGHLPSLSFSASMGSSYSSARSDDFNSQLADNRSERLGFNLSIPLFNRLNVKRGIESSRVQFSNAQLDLENAEQNVAIEVRQAYLDYLAVVKRLDVTATGLQAADQALRVEQERYDVGASTLVELTQSRSQYVNSASQRAQAIFQFHFQHRLIEYYQGTLDPNQPLFN